MPAHFAAQKNDIEVLKLTADEDGSPIDKQDEVSWIKFPASFCLWQKREFDDVSQYGETPLHQAAHKGCAQAVDLLINYLKANVTTQNIVWCQNISLKFPFVKSGMCSLQVGNTPLHIAAYRGHATIVELLTRSNSTVAKAKNHEGDTPLHLAASGGHAKVVEKLLQEDSDVVNAQNFKGRTPLHEAAESASESVIRLLMKARNTDHAIKDSVS